jgi:uncharacterized membrane protein YhaH (DUF805 family)
VCEVLDGRLKKMTREHEPLLDLMIARATEKYATFSGRATRREYWVFNLAGVLLSIVVTGIESEVEEFFPGNIAQLYYSAEIILFGCFSIPMVAVTVRRLHDTNRRGRWILMYLIPILGALWIIILLCLEGTEGENRFGENPLTHKSEDYQNR